MWNILPPIATCAQLPQWRYCGTSRAASHTRHSHLVKDFDPGQTPPPCCCCAAAEVEALWYEYERQQTPESHLVKDFDKLEMIIQALEYEGAQVCVPWRRFPLRVFVCEGKSMCAVTACVVNMS